VMPETCQGFEFNNVKVMVKCIKLVRVIIRLECVRNSFDLTLTFANPL
jgi:hypothetical protein